MGEAKIFIDKELGRPPQLGEDGDVAANDSRWRASVAYLATWQYVEADL
jgi:hypothetical protein